MNWYEWIFDGIGTAIFSAVLGLIIGGIGGFAIGRKTEARQIQNAGNNSMQKQQLATINKKGTGVSTDNVYQKQNARDNAEQVQIGVIKHGK